MKRSLWNITLAAVVTMVVYIALSAVWGAILNELENVTLQLFLLSLMTTVAYGIALLWVSKIRKSVGEDEVMADYREQSYTTMTNDLRLVLRKEAKTLILMTVVVLMTYILNRFDMLIFGKKMISHITFPYITMSLFGSLLSVKIIGYLLSAVLNSVVYLIALVLYRKKKYTYWMKNKG